MRQLANEGNYLLAISNSHQNGATCSGLWLQQSPDCLFMSIYCENVCLSSSSSVFLSRKLLASRHFFIHDPKVVTKQNIKQKNLLLCDLIRFFSISNGKSIPFLTCVTSTVQSIKAFTGMNGTITETNFSSATLCAALLITLQGRNRIEIISISRLFEMIFFSVSGFRKLKVTRPLER